MTQRLVPHPRIADPRQAAERLLQADADLDRARPVAGDGGESVVEHLVQGDFGHDQAVIFDLRRAVGILGPGPERQELDEAPDGDDGGAGVVDTGRQGAGRDLGQHDKAEAGVFLEATIVSNDETILDLGAQVVVDLSEGRPLRLIANSPENGMGMMGGGMMGRGNERRGVDQAFQILDIRTAGSASAVPLPVQLASLTPPDLSLAIRTRRFVLDMGMMGRGMSINGAAMDMNVINERVPVGQWEIWEIANASMMAHPFHIHNVQFQVLDRDGQVPPPLETGFKDTVVVNPREQVRVLLSFEENTDPDLPYMYHCHILEHEDAGMMGQFAVV